MPVLIDGYNLLFSYLLSHGELKQEREKMIVSLAELLKKAKKEATVVFDSHSPKTPATRGHFGSLEIIFTDQGEEADDYILRKIKASKRPALYLVVTGDKKLAERARRLLAKTISIKEWLQLTVKQAEKQALLEKEEREKPPSVAKPPPVQEKQVQERQEKKKPLSEEEYFLQAFEERYRQFEAVKKPEQAKQPRAVQKKKKPVPTRKAQEPRYASEEERWLNVFLRRMKNNE
ncbi:NYN domain-containing protein [Estrella lausannensis]|uniref:YacP-like NYN domain protein n=1 Tax=Estrella lausannensis TaxID=483423 RepID=A0A0H5DN25_9BACT|nr:NYN domain-containing protein [Estrella lausannensis]CRX37462.1 Conserved hypothetical protein [Estrella lausannensis]